MHLRTLITVLSAVLAALLLSNTAEAPPYRWASSYDSSETLAARIEPPAGFVRVPVEDESFADWLRGLPLKPEGSPVMLYDGRPKRNQAAHEAVVAIDPGKRNLLHCADAVIRLVAEWTYSQGRYDDIGFEFTSGDTASFRDWINGKRPVVSGSQVRWRHDSARDSSYESFREYLDTVYMYAGTISLERETQRVEDTSRIEFGDLFIVGGSPGHVVMVVDIADNHATAERAFLLAQSFMPAQEIHILRNPMDRKLSPWYIYRGGRLETPEYRFGPGCRRRF